MIFKLNIYILKRITKFFINKKFFTNKVQNQDYLTIYSYVDISSSNNKTPNKTLPSDVISFEKSQNSNKL